MPKPTSPHPLYSHQSQTNMRKHLRQTVPPRCLRSPKGAHPTIANYSLGCHLKIMTITSASTDSRVSSTQCLTSRFFDHFTNYKPPQIAKSAHKRAFRASFVKLRYLTPRDPQLLRRDPRFTFTLPSPSEISRNLSKKFRAIHHSHLHHFHHFEPRPPPITTITTITTHQRDRNLDS